MLNKIDEAVETITEFIRECDAYGIEIEKRGYKLHVPKEKMKEILAGRELKGKLSVSVSDAVPKNFIWYEEDNMKIVCILEPDENVHDFMQEVKDNAVV